MSSSDKNLDIDFHAIITSHILDDTHGLTRDFYKGYQDYSPNPRGCAGVDDQGGFDSTADR